jgi:hypothetical protein
MVFHKQIQTAVIPAVPTYFRGKCLESFEVGGLLKCVWGREKQQACSSYAMRWKTDLKIVRALIAQEMDHTCPLLSATGPSMQWCSLLWTTEYCL